MELKPMKDGIDGFTKKQEIFHLKCQQAIDELIQEMQEATSKIQSDQSQSISAILQQLGTNMKHISSHLDLKNQRKDLYRALTNYSKLLNTNFDPDISTAYRNVEMDTHTINQIILAHFFRQGLFELGDFFLKESSIEMVTCVDLEIRRLLQSLKNHESEPAFTWVSANIDKLRQNGWNDLELKLRRQQLVGFLQKRDGVQEFHQSGIQFLRGFFPNDDEIEIQRLAQCILPLVGRLEEPQYSDLLSSAHWDEIGEELTQAFWNITEKPERCPLKTTIAAGFQALPTLLKLMKTVFKGKKKEWEKMEELPVPVELDREFQFHSIFVCPISREATTMENHPRILRCGHVFSARSITKYWIEVIRFPNQFRCPICKAEHEHSRMLTF